MVLEELLHGYAVHLRSRSPILFHTHSLCGPQPQLQTYGFYLPPPSIFSLFPLFINYISLTHNYVILWNSILCCRGKKKQSVSDHSIFCFLISVHPSWLPPQISASSLFLVSGNKKVSSTLENPRRFCFFFSVLRLKKKQAAV